MPADFNPGGIEGLWGGRMWRFAELPSTNTWALDHAGQLGHGDVVWAESQTAGRGRLGRAWLALPGKCLTFSVILSKSNLVPLGPNLGQIAACAVWETLSGCGIQALLKWPNDVMVNDRKVAGLLVEQDMERALFVLGTGLNVNIASAELEAAKMGRPATSMREAAGHDFDPADVLRTLLGNLVVRLEQVEKTGLRPLWEIWMRHDWLGGRSIQVVGHDLRIQGDYRGVDEEGRLRIRIANGEEKALWTGDVERVREVKGRGV